MKVVKTGIAGLDEFLTGGLPPKILLASGVPGSGNEVFVRQVVYNRSKQSGITYFTVNGTFDSVKEDMACFNWDVTTPETSGAWKFESLAKTDDVKEIVIDEMRKHRTVVIDSLSELLLTRKIEDVILLLTAMARQNKNSDDYHLLLLTEGMQNQEAETAMQHFAEGVILFNTTWTSDATHRDLLIKKMKGIFIPDRRLPYTIGKRGFVIETATRIT